MAKIYINYKKYPRYPKDCKEIAKVIVPKLIDQHKLVVVNIIEHGTNTKDYTGRKTKVYGMSSIGDGKIDIYLNEIYDENRSNEHNRYRFLKVLVHECFHLKLGFAIMKSMIENTKITFRELQEFHVDRLAFTMLKEINSKYKVDIDKEPFNINKKQYESFIAESEAYWLSRIINKFNSLDLDNRVKLNRVFTSTVNKVSDVLTEELKYYFDKGYGFVDHSDSWKRARENEKKAKSETKGKP